MVTTSHLIDQLSKFPQGAKVLIVDDKLYILHPKNAVDCGVIHCPKAGGKPRATRLRGWEGWLDNVFGGTAGGRIQRFLLERPAAARCIAFSAVAGLYLKEDEETALHVDNSNPRGSGSDYVDCVGEAVEAAELMPLIEELQAEVPDDEEEDDNE